MEVEAQRGRCSRAPREASASQRGPEKQRRKIAYASFAWTTAIRPRRASAAGVPMASRRRSTSGVHAAHEERGHSRDVAQVAGAALQPAQVGLDHLLVARQGEDERDVDAVALSGECAQGVDARAGSRDLHVEVGSVDPGVEFPGGVHGRPGVVCQLGSHLHRDVAVGAATGVMQRPEYRQRGADVTGDEVPVTLLGARSTGGQLRQVCRHRRRRRSSPSGRSWGSR